MDFSEYVAARRPTLVRAAVLLGCSQDDAEDAVQTALVRCYRHWARVVRAREPDAYVYRVLVNCLHSARSRRWTGEVPTEHLPDRIDLADHDTGISVRRALLNMTPEHREVLVLRFYGDLSERTVAEVLGIPPGTVKSRTARALTALSEDQNIVRTAR